MTTTKTATAHTDSHACLLQMAGGTILQSTCPVTRYLYAAQVSRENAERAERRAATTTSYRQRVYSTDRAQAMRGHEADALRWAAEATCTA